jgi:lysozyme family protein
MADNFHGCLAFVLTAEGGWTDNPNDPGGCTMRGITLAAYRAWKRNPDVTCAELYVVSAPNVTGFYYDEYWVPMWAQKLPAGVDLMVMDAGVNMGVSRSLKLLQGQIGVAEDGVIGPSTLNATLNIEPAILVDSLAQTQTEFYQSLADYTIFGEGWLNRVNARHAAAVAMLKTS